MDEEIEPPQMYIFENVTTEVRNFVKTSQYQWIPIEKNGMLYYSVGISPTEKIQAASEMTEVMKDLSAQAHFLCHWYINFHHVHTV